MPLKSDLQNETHLEKPRFYFQPPYVECFQSGQIYVQLWMFSYQGEFYTHLQLESLQCILGGWLQGTDALYTSTTVIVGYLKIVRRTIYLNLTTFICLFLLLLFLHMRNMVQLRDTVYYKWTLSGFLWKMKNPFFEIFYVPIPTVII